MGKTKTEVEKQATRDARNERRRNKAAADKAAAMNNQVAAALENAVAVSGLPVGTDVILDGDEYRVFSIGNEIALLSYLENSPLPDAPKIERYQRPVPLDTLVAPV